jgi:hypothetical protein
MPKHRSDGERKSVSCGGVKAASRASGSAPGAADLHADEELHEQSVFDPHPKIFAAAAIHRKGAHQRILETPRRAGEKNEIQQQIKMEDDEDDRRENVKAEKR